ncbi:MAG: hypothetical protein ABSB58_05525 [Gemmatimonadales bacterium]|jgi:hypothetical protein
MNEFLWKRIERKLAALPDDRVYQVLDYVEFLESRYAAQEAVSASPFQKLAEKVEDTLRAGRVPVTAIRSTMDAMSAASRLMGGIAAAGRAVVDEVTAAAGGGPKNAEPPKGASPAEPAAPPAPGASGPA